MFTKKNSVKQYIEISKVAHALTKYEVENKIITQEQYKSRYDLKVSEMICFILGQ